MQTEYNLIKRGTTLPDDFLTNAILNREKYIIEQGFSDDEEWYDEYSSPVTAEVIGAIIIGSNTYKDIRYRLRTKNDKSWDLKETTIANLINSGR